MTSDVNMEDSLVICVLDGDESFPVSRSLLIEQSKVFEAMLESGMEESHLNELRIADFSADTVQSVLSCLQNSNSFCTELQANAVDMLKFANKYDIKRVFDAAETFIISTLSPSNVVDMLKLSDIHSCVRLKAAAMKFVVNNPLLVLLESQIIPSVGNDLGKELKQQLTHKYSDNTYTLIESESEKLQRTRVIVSGAGLDFVNGEYYFRSDNTFIRPVLWRNSTDGTVTTAKLVVKLVKIRGPITSPGYYWKVALEYQIRNNNTDNASTTSQNTLNFYSKGASADEDHLPLVNIKGNCEYSWDVDDVHRREGRHQHYLPPPVVQSYLTPISSPLIGVIKTSSLFHIMPWPHRGAWIDGDIIQNTAFCKEMCGSSHDGRWDDHKRLGYDVVEFNGVLYDMVVDSEGKRVPCDAYHEAGELVEHVKENINHDNGALHKRKRNQEDGSDAGVNDDNSDDDDRD